MKKQMLRFLKKRKVRKFLLEIVHIELFLLSKYDRHLRNTCFNPLYYPFSCFILIDK